MFAGNYATFVFWMYSASRLTAWYLGSISAEDLWALFSFPRITGLDAVLYSHLHKGTGRRLLPEIPSLLQIKTGERTLHARYKKKQPWKAVVILDVQCTSRCISFPLLCTTMHSTRGSIEGPGGLGPLAPKICFDIMHFSGNFKGKPSILSNFWAHGPLQGQNSAGPTDPNPGTVHRHHAGRPQHGVQSRSAWYRGNIYPVAWVAFLWSTKLSVVALAPVAVCIKFGCFFLGLPCLQQWATALQFTGRGFNRPSTHFQSSDDPSWELLKNKWSRTGTGGMTTTVFFNPFTTKIVPQQKIHFWGRLFSSDNDSVAS